VRVALGPSTSRPEGTPTGADSDAASPSTRSDKTRSQSDGSQSGDGGVLEFVAEPQAPQIAELAAYWEEKRAGRMAPRRADIDPTEIPHHLRHIFMVDVIDEGADFRYRLMGTAITEGMGRDSTGKVLSELYRDQPDAFDKIAGSLRQVIADRRPLFSRGQLFWLPHRAYRRFAGLGMPLSDDGTTVNIILCEMILLPTEQ
jgi:hypothetical protein